MRTVPLGDVCHVTTGQSAPQESTAFGSSGTPFVRAGSLERLCSGVSEESLELVPSDQAVKFRLKKFPKDTIVFAKSGMSAKLGRVYRLRRECHVVSHLAAVLPSADVDPAYLLRWFEYSPPSRLIENDAYPSIKTSTLEKIPVHLPEIAEQRRIAAILDKADALRFKRREAIVKIDQLLQSVFVDMFGDPAKNPKGFDVCALEEISDRSDRINYGVVQPGSEFSDGVPIVRVGDIEGGELDASSIKRIDPVIEAAYTRSRLKGNEILISCVGSIGTIAIVPASAIGFNIARAITRVPLKNPESRSFVKACLRSAGTQNYFMEKTRTVSQPTLNVEFVKQTPVLSPPIELQQRFSNIASALELQKRQLRISASQLDTLFASLQRRAFTGQL